MKMKERIGIYFFKHEIKCVSTETYAVFEAAWEDFVEHEKNGLLNELFDEWGFSKDDKDAFDHGFDAFCENCGYGDYVVAIYEKEDFGERFVQIY